MKELAREEHHVMREGGTEAPFSGEYVDNHEAGVYRCKQCGNILFDSSAKFDSGTGWPSFTDSKVVDEQRREDTEVSRSERTENVGTRLDRDDSRTEVFCKNCGGHLGHVFNDGPAAGGKRYCINSVCLEFEKGN